MGGGPGRSPELGGLVEVRLHGRGGQGTVVASLLLARAAMLEGRGVQAFPEFGVERRGAPVTAFLRLSDAPIRLRCKVYEPDHVVVLDPSLLAQVDLPRGGHGWLVVNSPSAPADLAVPEGWRVAAVDATRLARAHGVGGGALPVVNSPMAGAFARASGLVGLASLEAAIREMAPSAEEANVRAAREAWDAVRLAAPPAGAPAREPAGDPAARARPAAPPLPAAEATP
jgi:2-oxoacid:acceptor oxidoreductase gamma subunit (pyruvate/2-ketoisovalerate family)